jgi:hypothetical protein
VGKAIGRANNKGLEGITRIEGRSFKPVETSSAVAGRHWYNPKRRRRCRRWLLPRHKRFFRHRGGLKLFYRSEMWLPDPELQTVNTAKFGPATGKQFVGIM